MIMKMKMHKCCSKNKGFVALTLVIFITGTLLVLTSTTYISHAHFFDLALRKEYRIMNYYYAGVCIDQAILELAKDYFLSIKSPQEIKYFHCSILSITKDGDSTLIKTRGDYQKAYVYRSATVKVKTHDLEVVKIE
jgi:hypothetical protein